MADNLRREHARFEQVQDEDDAADDAERLERAAVRDGDERRNRRADERPDKWNDGERADEQTDRQRQRHADEREADRVEDGEDRRHDRLASHPARDDAIDLAATSRTLDAGAAAPYDRCA